MQGGDAELKQQEQQEQQMQTLKEQQPPQQLKPEALNPKVQARLDRKRAAMEARGMKVVAKPWQTAALAGAGGAMITGGQDG